MEKTWTPLELVKVSAGYLAQKSVPQARLDAEVLLAHVLGCKGRVGLYAAFEKPVEGEALARYRELIRRRAAREPVSRILGEREFMGLPFRVTPAVLSPRPETEILVEAVVRRIEGPKKRRSEQETPADGAAPAAPSAPATPRILDLGTGSGCIALAVAAQCPGARITAIDLSAEALAVARENADRLGLAERVEFREGDWFGACRPGETFDYVLSNPPYIADGDPEVWPEVRDYDPPGALYAGPDGLAAHKRIASGVEIWLNPGAFVFLEVGAGQAAQVCRMLRETTLLEEISAIRDHAGIDRVVTARRPAL